jgi:hypothetical protein
MPQMWWTSRAKQVSVSACGYNFEGNVRKKREEGGEERLERRHNRRHQYDASHL